MKRGTRIQFLMLAAFASVSLHADSVNFNRDVRPILSDRCFHCHGPDEHERKGKLRLDVADGDHGAYRILDGVQGIKPGDLQASEVWQRITTQDDDEVMPPADSHKKQLTPDEKAVIKKWIKAGAKYESFWAFQKPVARQPPASSWGTGTIDAYVADRHRAEGLQPSPQADRRTLLRRLTFDLTGLPPTLDELAAFEADASPDAYERRVDALLARPQYGEHVTRYWADLVRLADTNGLHTDRYRDFSTYRAWVIRAFNSNMPFDQFIRDQLAGDLYDNPTVDQRVASGFNRLNLMFERGSVLPEESLYRNVLDRVEAVGTAFMGLTLQCAQCHDHKYDPISQREYFQFYAFFNNFSGAPQTGPSEPNGIQEPSIAVPAKPEDQERLVALDKKLAELQTKVAATRKPGVRPAAAAPTVQYWNFDDGRGATATNAIASGNPGTIAGTPRWSKPGLASAGALHLSPESGGYVDGGNLNLTATAAGGQVSISMWLQPAGFSGDNRIIGQLSGISSQAGVVRVLANGALEVWNGGTWLALAPAGALSVGVWQHLALVWNGDAVTAYLNGVAQLTAAAGFHFGAENGNFGIGAPFLKQYGAAFDGKIDDLAVFNIALSQAQVALVAGEQDSELASEYQVAIEAINHKRRQLSRTAGRAMVMRERVPMRKTFLRVRGAYHQLGEEVQRGTPAFLPPLQVAGDVPSRMDLANWLASPEHPLTARVTVNRFWQQLFGVGLVKTSEDFGAQGEWPSHPELLDYLAVRFIESGWDVKALMREIVLSATYQQQSDAPAAAYRADPENRLLARASRFRMDAEMIRDQLLAVSGKLNATMYGKSVKPPQPPGLWKSVTMTNELFKADSGDAIYRRSLYTFWKRVMPPPQMSIMNAPSREFCVARRERTNTPLQALVLMNEPEYLKLARACANRTLEEVDNDPAAALPRLYERITSQQPNTAELQKLTQALSGFERYYRERPELTQQLAPDAADPVRTATWTMLAHSLLNLETAKVRR